MPDIPVLGKPADGASNAGLNVSSAPVQSAGDSSSKNSQDDSGRVNENTNDNGVGDNNPADAEVKEYCKHCDENGNGVADEFNFG